jgi:hypothetical protein
MLEAGQTMPPNDPRVGDMAALLTRLTAMYIEDAPRIAEMTIKAVGGLQAVNQAVSPSELLTGAIQWPRGHGRPGSGPRKYADYLRHDRASRHAGP